jgi:RecG-like helicase
VTEIRQESGNWLSRRFRRLTVDPNELDAEALLSDVRKTAGCEPVSQCHRGKVVTVTGRLKSVVHLPEGSVPTLEAELYDGSGSVILVWLGRRQIAGIEPGRTVTARGRIAENQGRGVIYNPWYELSPA